MKQDSLSNVPSFGKRLNPPCTLINYVHKTTYNTSVEIQCTLYIHIYALNVVIFLSVYITQL